MKASQRLVKHLRDCLVYFVGGIFKGDFYNMSLQDLCLMGFLVIYNCCCSFLLIPLTIISACMEPGRRDKPVFDIKCFLSHSP